jgi:hypothetical protein
MTVKTERLSINVTWIHTLVSLLVICSTVFGGIWWVVGERTRFILNEDFWASERIRPAMRIYIQENTVSKSDFNLYVLKNDTSHALIQSNLNSLREDLHQSLSTPSRAKH